MNLDDVASRAIDIRDRYRALNLREGRREWRAPDYMLGFVGDVGDLAKLVMAEDGTRSAFDVRSGIEHELADCLWSVVVLADCFDVDLAAAFRRTMDDLESHIAERLGADG